MSHPDGSASGDDFESLLRDLGLSREKLDDLIEGPSPEPLDEDRIRALDRGALDEIEAQKVIELIALYREWHDAALRIWKDNTDAGN